MNSSPNRLVSLDQFRGYTVLGMFAVNFLGGYKAVPAVFHHHHTYCSYADTIMPQFLFAVGFAMRISFCSRAAKEGINTAYRHFAGRCLGLILLGIVLYHLTGKYETWDSFANQDWSSFLIKTIKRGPFETLTHIGVTSLWVLPVIAQSVWIRLAFAVVSAGAHVALSLWFYYDWNMASPAGIDGGPLGFLTWTIPVIAGTLARDLFLSSKRPVSWLTLGAIPVMAIAIGLSSLNSTSTWPFCKPDPDSLVRDYWLMSQRAGSLTYVLFATGFAMAIYALFAWACDRAGFAWSLFGLLGRNALAGYIVHDMVAGCVKPFCPKDSPGWWVLSALATYLAITFLFLKYLDNRKLWLKL